MIDDTNASGGSPASDVSSESPQVDQSSSESQGQESQQASLEARAQSGSPSEKAEAKKMLKRLTLKIDGESFDEELPFEIDESQADYMRKQLQLSKKAQKSMQSESQLRSQVQELVNLSKNDRKKFLETFGIDPKDLAAQIIEEELHQQAMTPEQKERAELQSKLKKMEDERRLEKEDFDKREYERLTQQEYERIDTRMTAVIDQAGIPKSPYVVKKIAQYMSDGIKFGVNLQPEDVIDLVKEELYEDFKAHISALGDDKLESFIGKDILDKVRKKNLAKAKPSPASVKAAIKDVGASKKADAKPAEKINMRDFFKI